MRPAALAFALLLLAPAALPAAEAATTMFLSIRHSWTGPNGGIDARPFTVPASTPVVCYVRWASESPATSATAMKATLFDGDAFPVVVDAWAHVAAPVVGGFHTANTFPLLLSRGAFTPGLFVFEMQTAGFTGDVGIQVYGASTISECGTLPPP